MDGTGAFTADFNQGLYGIGIAGGACCPPWASPWPPTPYGPVADNAGGIAEMSRPARRGPGAHRRPGLPGQHHRRHRQGLCHRLRLPDRPGPAGLLREHRPGPTVETLNFTLTSPTVLVGLFIGALLAFVFSAMTMSAVQTAAQSIVVEVRRQFREIAGIMEGKADPDYAKCVSLCTKGALHEMVVPCLLAIIVPIVTGLILGPTGVVGLLGGVSVTGFAMAVFMSNAGGAWDNAKKYIERGNHGGKGSERHKAAVVGDTVGDPFKDTSGPSPEHPDQAVLHRLHRVLRPDPGLQPAVIGKYSRTTDTT